MENNAAQTDAPSINHSEEAAGLFKQLLQLYQHLGGMANGTRERETATTQDTFNSCRTKSRLVAHTNVSSPPPPPPVLHFHLQKKKKKKTTKKRSPACNSQASCRTFRSVNASSDEKYLTDSQPRARNVQLGYYGREKEKSSQR